MKIMNKKKINKSNYKIKIKIIKWRLTLDLTMQIHFRLILLKISSSIKKIIFKIYEITREIQNNYHKINNKILAIKIKYKTFK